MDYGRSSKFTSIQLIAEFKKKGMLFSGMYNEGQPFKLVFLMEYNQLWPLGSLIFSPPARLSG